MRSSDETSFLSEVFHPKISNNGWIKSFFVSSSIYFLICPEALAFSYLSTSARISSFICAPSMRKLYWFLLQSARGGRLMNHELRIKDYKIWGCQGCFTMVIFM